MVADIETKNFLLIFITKMLNLKNLKKDLFRNDFSLFIREKHFKLDIIWGQVIYSYYNDYQLSSQEKNTLDLEISSVKKEIDDLEKVFSSSDDEVKIKKASLKKLEYKFQAGCLEYIASSNISLQVRDGLDKETIETFFSLYLKEKIIINRASWKDLTYWQILRDAWLAMLIDWEKKQAEKTNGYLEKIFKIKE